MIDRGRDKVPDSAPDSAPGSGTDPAHDKTRAPVSALDAAYRATDYCVDLPSGERVVLRIGEPSPAAFAAALRAAGVSTWAIVAAVNPGSQLLADADNRRRHRRLAEAVAAAGRRAWPGGNRAAGWPDEPTLCVLDLPRDEALRLAAAFAQNAIVAPGDDGLPALVWLPPA